MENLRDWAPIDNKITKTFKFKDFITAMSFINQIAKLAETEGHHPDIAINYNQVTLTLWTHDLGRVGPKDFELAAKINQAATQF